MQETKAASFRELFMVAACAALLFVPFLGSVHLFDWDEINFAESAREMIVSGNYSRVQINFKPFWEKPPLFFWLQALSMKAFGINEFAARFPNAICGIITLTLLYYLGRKYMNRSFAAWWVLFMAGSLTPHLYFKSGIIDPWFNLFIFLSAWQLVQTTLRPGQKNRRFLYAGLYCGLAFLTKGPVALLIVGLCGFVFLVMQRFRPFFKLTHLLLFLLPFLAIASLWLVPEISSNGFSVVGDFIAYQADLFLNPVAGHGQPFYYHALVLLGGCFPASWCAIKGMTMKAAEGQTKHLKTWMSILFWVVLILFSLVKTKIVHYSSLCYIPLTFLAAYAISELKEKQQPLPRWVILGTAFLGMILIPILTVLPLIETFKAQLIPYIKDPFAVASLLIDSPWEGYELLPGAALLIIFLAAVSMMAKGQGIQGMRVLLVTMAAFIPAYLRVVVPKIEAYSQGPAIDFYSRFAGRPVYIESLKHKSYAQYFYAQCQPGDPRAADMEWLLHGEADRPVFFVAKVTSEKDCADLPLEEIDRKGGFILYKRKTP